MAHSSPLVSVLVNNYNYARFLPEALESVLQQTYQNFEIIVVDDGSIDNSREVIESFAVRSKKIKAVFKENGGQASAYNAAVAAARGEILCFLDSDDVWFPEKLEVVVEAHRKHAFVQHDVEKNGESNFAHPSAHFDRQALLKNYGCLLLFSPSSAMSLRADLAKQIFPIPERGLEICADLFVFFVGTYLQGIFTIEQRYARYRIHGGNYWQEQKRKRSKEAGRKYFAVLEIVNRWLFARGHYPIPTMKWVLYERMLEDLFELEKAGRYIVYGTGRRGEELKELIEFHGGQVMQFVDSFSDRWGADIQGVSIVSPTEIPKLLQSADKLLIASNYVGEILEEIKKHHPSLSHVAYPPNLFIRGFGRDRGAVG